MKLNIKNMVCGRCIMVVDGIFKAQGIDVETVSLGEVQLPQEISPDQLSKLNSALKEKGFEVIDDKKSLLLERVKSVVIDEIHHNDHFELKVNWSHFLQEKLQTDYHHLSTLFSSVNGYTLEQYIIKQKVEKVKEYLFYDEMSLKEIAFKLGYSSVAHLSTQFKKITGLTPSKFKETLDNRNRLALDQI
ncbi:helix-turn-helix transcriptional regulator [Aegicerativicinus sediminis]|uniref:helix-turn-helix transcriptional regulator n=1 Tax=Aegicerativicinus sediminis TaxID=2893202 RepID=UPI001E2DBAE5|nr:helix-turn-helix transcriptional regulator [Aegicerativicinus sediminis]